MSIAIPFVRLDFDASLFIVKGVQIHGVVVDAQLVASLDNLVVCENDVLVATDNGVFSHEEAVSTTYLRIGRD